MNLTRAEKARLGIFLVTGVAILVGALVILTGVKLLTPRDIYTARFTESVAGLEPSAPVRYQGLRVGRVESMEIAADDPTAIEVTIALDRGTVLYEGTQAVLDQSGLTGLKTINLTPGDVRRPKLAPGARLPTAGSFIDEITNHAAAVVADVRRIADQVSRWTSDDNRVRLESLLAGLDTFVGHVDTMLTESREPFGEAVTEITRTAAAMTRAADESAKTLQVVRGSLVSTQASLESTLQAVRRPLASVDPKALAQTVVSIQGAASRLEQRLSADETGEAIANLGQTLNRLNGLIQDVDLAVRAGREDFTATLSYMRQASEDLREFSRILAQNPSVLFRGQEYAE